MPKNMDCLLVWATLVSMGKTGHKNGKKRPMSLTFDMGSQSLFELENTGHKNSRKRPTGSHFGVPTSFNVAFVGVFSDLHPFPHFYNCRSVI